MKNTGNHTLEDTVIGTQVTKIVPRITGGRVVNILKSTRKVPPGIPYGTYQNIMSSIEWRRLILTHPEYFVEYKGHKYIKPEHKKDILPALTRLINNPDLHRINPGEYCRAR